MISQNTPNKLNRRDWLRTAAITATGAVVLPPLLTRCTKIDDVIPNFGNTAPPLTQVALDQASSNLMNMNAWVTDLYILTGNYEQYVLHSILGGSKPTDWKDFTLNIFTQIAAGILQAAFKVFEFTAGPFVGPVLAITDALIKKFAFGTAPKSLYAAFADFENSHLEMQMAISCKLLDLADSKNNYQALRDEFKGGDLEFNGKKYTLQDLANAKFPFVDSNRPNESSPAEYEALRTAAYNQFVKHIWNVLIMKAGHIEGRHWGNVTLYDLEQNGGCVHDWAMNKFYSNQSYAGGYLRGYYREGFFEGYSMEYWLISFDGTPLSESAAKELFIDYTPGHIMNPDPEDKTKPLTGLWPRDYVYKQFNTTKTDFWGYFDLAKVGEAQCYGSLAFDESTYNYEYTGGDFPQLIKNNATE